MEKRVILVTGSNGQVGKELQQLTDSYPQYQFVFAAREDMELHHFGLVENFFIATKPQSVRNIKRSLFISLLIMCLMAKVKHLTKKIVQLVPSTLMVNQNCWVNSCVLRKMKNLSSSAQHGFIQRSETTL